MGRPTGRERLFWRASGQAKGSECSEAPCFMMGGGYGRAPRSVVPICLVSAAISISRGDSSSSVAFLAFFGRRVRVSSKCRRLIWPKAIRLSGNAPIGVTANGLGDARMAAISRPSYSSMRATLLLDGLVLVSVLFVMMNSPFIWICEDSLRVLFSTKPLRDERGRSAGESRDGHQCQSL